jgi:hypothetical protein
MDLKEMSDFLPECAWCRLFVFTRGLGPRMSDFFHSRFAPEHSLADVDLAILGLVASSELPMDSVLETDFLEQSSATLGCHGFAAAGSGGGGQSGADSGAWP